MKGKDATKKDYSSIDQQEEDNNDNKHEKSGWDRSNIFGKYAFIFLWPLFRKSWTGLIEFEDIGPPPLSARSEKIGRKLERNYNYELTKSEPSFSLAIIKTFGPELLGYSLADLVGRCVAYPLQAIALGWLIRDSAIYLTFADTTNTNRLPPAQSANNTGTFYDLLYRSDLTADDAYWRIVYNAILLVAMTATAFILSHPFFFMSQHIGMKCRVAACHMIYKKSLRLGQSAMFDTTAGQMVNLLSNDVNRFDQSITSIPYLLIAPIQGTIVIVILSTSYIGLIPTLTTLATLLFYILLQTLMGRGFSKFRARTAKRTDERVRLMNEIILAIRIIKIYAWEKSFKQLIYFARKREMTVIGIATILKAINQTLFFVSSKIIVFIALMTYVLLGNRLDPELVFVSISLANLLRFTFTLIFPNAVAQFAETLISCRRINTFLLLPEVESSAEHYKAMIDCKECPCVVNFMDVTSSWKSIKGARKSLIFKNLTFAVEPEDLVLLVGRIGSGKSSLLMSILGELPASYGRIEVNGKISYASQEAWIFSGSVRDNILFGTPYEEKRYQEVIRVCSLQRDLSILVDGDMTIVGERGVSLSGGQKARVNLARALYRDADLYLLDDPLSAVDIPVARHIFRESLKQFLRKKTVILATHQLQFLPYASKVLVLDRDQPALFGTLEQVKTMMLQGQSSYEINTFIDAAKAGTISDSDEETSKVSVKESIEGALDIPPEQKLNSRTQETGERQTGKDKLTATSADCSTYLFYLRNAAGCIAITWFILINFACQFIYQLTDYFLSYWTDSQQRKEIQGSQFQVEAFIDESSLGEVTGIYGILVVLCILTAFARGSTMFIGTLRASIKIHDSFFGCIINAPMSFFDFSPIGILLNRLSRDIGIVDETLPSTLIEIFTIFVNIAGIIILTWILDLNNLISGFVLLAAAVGLQRICANTVTRLKQMEGATKSPIYSHLSTTLCGLPTIRAFKSQQNFMNNFDRYQDDHSSAWFHYICSSRWLAVSIDWLCLIFVISIITILLAFSLTASNASLIGLLISQVVIIPGPLQWGMRQLIELGSQMTSVQRIKEYSNLKSEEESLRDEPSSSELAIGYQSIAVPGSWIKTGEIVFKDVSLQYFTDETPVLKQLNFTIRAREKVAIVGRTGAGKSSIVSVLFRLYKFQGVVEIDGCNTKTLELTELRRSMSIIPQDPVLFGGTIRKNLDPFSDYTDEELWAALEAVQLKDLFMRYDQGLEYVISEGGGNFSVGQRQLICLARAIVRRNKILVLDEATANVDPETDSFIQRTIAQEFVDCTVVTIAHRLITIVDADRVLVLDHGKVIEFDEPFVLSKKDQGLFSSMIDSAKQQAPRIRRLIEEAHQRRQSQR